MIGPVFAALLAAAAQPPDAPPPVYAQRTRTYDVALRIDPPLKAFGGVYVEERDATLRGFNAFEREADRMGGLQGADAGPWVERVDYTLAAETPHLIGVIRRAYVARHGARPEISIQGFILDRASGHPIGASDLLQPGTDMAPLDEALQRAVDQAKSARHDGHPPPTPPGSALLTWDAGRPAINPRRSPPGDASLMPSGVPGKAGGLQFVFSPYVDGAYSDGSYRVVLPLQVFAARLRPQYREDFADAGPTPPDDPLAGFPDDLPPTR